MNGGPIQPGDHAPYEAEFENVGDATVRRISVAVPLSPELDPATFTLDSVRVGTTDIDMAARGDWQMHGEHDVPINDTTNRVIVDSTFTPNQCPTATPCSGTLFVRFAGPALRVSSDRSIPAATSCRRTPRNRRVKGRSTSRRR